MVLSPIAGSSHTKSQERTSLLTINVAQRRAPPRGSVSDPKKLFPDPYPTLKGIPDPTSHVFPDPIPDPGQNLTFLLSQRTIFFQSFRSVKHWDCSTVLTNFKIFKYLLTSKFYIFDINYDFFLPCY